MLGRLLAGPREAGLVGWHRGRKASGPAEKETGQQAKMKKGGEKKKTFFFLFSRVLANHFQIDFVSKFKFDQNQSLPKIKVQQHVCIKRLLTLYLILIS